MPHPDPFSLLRQGYAGEPPAYPGSAPQAAPGAYPAPGYGTKQ